MKQLLSILIVVLVIACAPIYVNYDYDNQTDFGTYKTYNFYPQIETGLNELENKRLFAAIDDVLLSKGFKISDTPDFYINIQSEDYQSDTRNTVGVGIGGSGRRVGGGINIGIPVGQGTMNRQLIFELIDTKKDVLYWQAISDARINTESTPEERQARWSAIVTKVFSKYPPK